LFATATWAAPDRNPWAVVPLAVMKRYMDIPAPLPGQTGIFAFADRQRLADTLVASGFRDVSIESLDVTWSGPASGQDYFNEVIEMAGPLASLYAKLPDGRRREYADEVAAAAQRQSIAKTGIALPGVTWIASGRK
jgi:hypothetical protein